MGQEFCQVFKFRFFLNFVSKIVRQNQNLVHKNHDFDIEFMILVSKIIFHKSKIVFSYSARIYFFTPKFNFFFDQNLDFVLG